MSKRNRTAGEIALSLSLPASSLDGLAKELRRHHRGDKPLKIDARRVVGERLDNITAIIADVRESLNAPAVPEKSKWLLLAETYEQREPRLNEIVEFVRGYAFPITWGWQGNGPTKRATLRVEFEIEANERETWEYLEDIKASIVSYVTTYTITEIKEKD